jgi:hypothetical protein
VVVGVLAAIVVCEISFWLVLLAGLTLRYLLGHRTTGAVVLAAVPLVDVALLAFTVVHLRSGAAAGLADGLAAVYIGVSVGFGRSMIRWADARFAHRFAGGPPPPRPPRTGPAHARWERRQWYRHVLAFAVGAALLVGGAVLVGDAGRAGALLAWLPRWALVLIIDGLWSLSYTIWPRRALRH